MFESDDYLPLSGLRQLLYCPRCCALIHVEGQWQESGLTASGRLSHARVDSGEHTATHGSRVERGLALRSDRLRLVGKADVVELLDDISWPTGVRAFPVEYKSGRRGPWAHHDVQLCAQAIALEEMLGVPVPCGAIFYGASRRRRDVAFDEELRDLTTLTARRFHDLVAHRTTPRAEPGPRCRDCSLRELCLPEVTDARTGRASEYMAKAMDGGVVR